MAIVSTPNRENPISVSIVGRKDEHHQEASTGTLIAPDVVLTAAHCLDPI